MKTILMILFVFISFNTFAQQTRDDSKSVEMQYSAADSIVNDSKNNTVHLYGKVTFAHQGINFNADEVVIYKNTNKVVATGSIVIVSVPMIKGFTETTQKKLLYTMGERFVVLE